jgi:hypothetical protein
MTDAFPLADVVALQSTWQDEKHVGMAQQTVIGSGRFLGIFGPLGLRGRNSRDGRVPVLGMPDFGMAALGALVLLAALSPQPTALAQQAAKPANDVSLLVVQVPVSPATATWGDPASSPLALIGEGGRLIELRPDGSQRVLSEGFQSVADVSLAFDGQRCVFAGKRNAADVWNVFEMDLADGQVTQLTRDFGNCRQPGYQSNLFTVDSPAPWYQLTFVSDSGGWLREDGTGVATSLYSCRLDGTQLRRMTFNLSDDADPLLMGDGRVLYAAWQRSSLARGPLGRVALFAVNIEGTDNALFAETSPRRYQRMPCVTDHGLVVFVESEAAVQDGAGQLGSVTFRRPLHSYRPLTAVDGGHVYRAPAPWTQGRILVSRSAAQGARNWGLFAVDPKSGTCDTLLDDPAFHEIQAIAVRARRQPDGRSTVVDDEKPLAKMYCLSVYQHDLPTQDWLSPLNVKRVRLLEGVPAVVPLDSPVGAAASNPAAASDPAAAPEILQPALTTRRLLGEAEIQADGSFHLSIPANLPVELQLIDQQGMALRTCGWIWSKNVEARGCIGCHEDGESTPRNVFTEGLKRPAVALTLPPERRRTVDFRRDIMPIVEAKCVSCHGADGDPPRLDGGMQPLPGRSYNQAYAGLMAIANPADAAVGRGRYVHCGSARTSPLLWHLIGKNTSQPWDSEVTRQQPAKPIPAGKVPALTNLELRLFIEWVDMGALWDGIPGADDFTAGSPPNTPAR